MNITKPLQKLTPYIIAALLSVVSLTAIVALTPQASAQGKDDVCQGASLSFSQDDTGPDRCQDTDNDGDVDENTSESRINGLIRDIVNILSVIVGIIAVIMIIVGGLKFITSGGDSNRVSSAKQTVIYAIIGLIIVALAQVIVRFVLNKVA
jgi:hypothetical protein